ncbi:hypothetical protein DPMN_042777 [Dreissena polymorpha]|nr:hypothetical protein DPMN_042777 [Dreissena polymorpha]
MIDAFVGTRTPSGDHQKMEDGLVWTRQQARLSVQGCAKGHARESSTSGHNKKNWMDNVKEWTHGRYTNGHPGH